MYLCVLMADQKKLILLAYVAHFCFCENVSLCFKKFFLSRPFFGCDKGAEVDVTLLLLDSLHHVQEKIHKRLRNV